ncbi:hypothetical protein V1523DRAFT_436543 [Lipomyces doorenjongii]
MAIGDVSSEPVAWRSSSLVSLHHHYHFCRMNRASVAKSEGLGPTGPRTYTALSKSHKIPRTTLWNLAHGRPSIKEKAKRLQYLTPSEEKALVNVRQRSSVFQAPSTDEKINKRPGKNWPPAFFKRHPELKPKRVQGVKRTMVTTIECIFSSSGKSGP